MKVYKFTETGEIRPPKAGEWFASDVDDIPLYSYGDNTTSGMGTKRILSLEITEEKWRPKEGETYFYIDFLTMSVIYALPIKVSYHSPTHDNCFRTREQAQTVLDKIKAILKGENNDQ